MASYEELTDRHIGILTRQEQEKLRASCVAVFGVGGLGGVIVEILARTGVGHLKLIEPDSFDPSNLNRHVFCYQSNNGERKIDVAEKFIADINDELKVEKYTSENEENIDEILNGVDAISLSVDKVRACILVSREAKKREIPFVEGWAIPYGNVRVYTKETVGLEELYHLPSIGKELNSLTHEDFLKMDLIMLQSLSGLEGITDFFTDEAEKRIFEERKNPSFAPLVWLTAVLMALEIIKVLLSKEKLSLAPKLSLYDPFNQRIPTQG